MTQRLTLVVLLCAGLLVAGCGGDGEPSSTQRQKAKGTGYTYELPPRWRDRSKAAAGEKELEFIGFRPDTFAVGPLSEGFAPNVNVIRARGVSREMGVDRFAQGEVSILRDPDQLPPDQIGQLGKFRPREISSLRRVKLGGEEARAIDYTAERGGRVLRFRLVLALRGGAGYSLTFTSLAHHFREDVRALSAVTRSWRWTG